MCYSHHPAFPGFWRRIGVRGGLCAGLASWVAGPRLRGRGFHLRSGLHDRRRLRVDKWGEVEGVNLALNPLQGINACHSRNVGRRRTPFEYHVFCAPFAKELDSDVCCILAFPHRPQVAIVEEHDAGSSVRVSQPYERPKISFRSCGDLNAVECSLVAQFFNRV